MRECELSRYSFLVCLVASVAMFPFCARYCSSCLAKRNPLVWLSDLLYLVVNDFIFARIDYEAPESQPLTSQTSGSIDLIDEGDTVLKPATPNEMAFFESVLGERLSVLSRFVVTFRGLAYKPHGDFEGCTQLHSKPHRMSKFILNSADEVVCLRLDNALHGFAHPCTMDLKMGTRQYRDADSPEKKASKERKCLASTSHSLGVRLSGMKIEHQAGGSEVCYRKGDTPLSECELESKLEQFLLCSSDPAGTALAIAEQLSELREAVIAVNYRFYGSSVFLVMDSATCNFRVKLIDFGSHQLPGEDDQAPYDEGFVLGLDSLISKLERHVS